MAFERYSRQILFKQFGAGGQEKLRQTRAAIVGVGALGSVSAEMFVRAGIGSLRLIDRDFVEVSNLHRQSLFTEEDARVGLPKAVAAEASLRKINSEVQVTPLVNDLSYENIVDLCADVSVIIDGTDNFETRYLLNDFSVERGIPWIYGACLGSFGTACAFVPGITPCFRCFCEEPPAAGSIETCDTAGVISPIVHIVASFQVSQLMKLVAGKQHQEFKLLQVDVWEDTWRSLSLGEMKKPGCVCCAGRKFPFLKGSEHARLTRFCGRNAVQVSPVRPVTVDFQKLAARLSGTGQVIFNPYMMKIILADYEIALFPDGRSIIKGTEDFSEARAVYARFIGT